QQQQQQQATSATRRFHTCRQTINLIAPTRTDVAFQSKSLLAPSTTQRNRFSSAGFTKGYTHKVLMIKLAVKGMLCYICAINGILNVVHGVIRYGQHLECPRRSSPTVMHGE
ncbi:unnamed protein product, partial [Meganyctiphanes norvegica]